jgi:RHS repeat-associated protein
VQRTVNGVAAHLAYDGWTLLEERTAAGLLAARYVHGLGTDEPLAMLRADGKTLFYHQDGLGSVSALTDETGKLVERYLYDVYGAATVVDGTGALVTGSLVGNRFLYTGREWIAEAELYDYRNRVYSAELGRFLQADPIRFAGGDLNIYRYVGNNGVNCSDPLGLWTYITIIRDAPTQKNPTYDNYRDAPGTMYINHNGKWSQTRVNENGYQKGTHGVHPENYTIVPRTDAEPGNNPDGSPKSIYPNGTPGLVAGGETVSGNAGHGYKNVYIHRKTDGLLDGDSRGCLTVDSTMADAIKNMVLEDAKKKEGSYLFVRCGKNK